MSATKRKSLMLVFVLIGVSWMFVGCSKGDPELEVSSSTLEFGTAQTQKQISVKNTGNDDGILKSGVKPLNYELDPNVSWISVSPSSGRCEKDETDKITVSINRTRMTSGTNSGRIDISSNGGDKTVQVTAVKLTPPVCSVSSTTLSFGDVQVGQSKDLTFTITNTGGGTLSGSVSESCSHYSIVSGSGSYSLGAGRSRTVKVRFSPTSTGTKNCTIQTGSSCSNVDCTGVGEEIPPCCSVSPASLNFGNVQVGQSKDLTFTITNCGSTGLTGTISENCVQYSIVSGGGSYSLSPGRSRTVTIRFSPTSTGTKPCTIQTGNNACSDVNCTGVGIEPQCSVSPTSLNFDDVLVGQSKDMIFTIGNPSGAATNLTGSVSESCSHYSIVSGGGSYNLSPSQSRTVTVRFAPTSTGTKNCTIEMGNSACSDVSCTGNGEQPCCSISPTSLSFGNVCVGGSKDLCFTITNCSGTCTLSGTISESCSHYSIVSSGGSYNLSPGQSRTVCIRFAPMSVGSHTCCIDVGPVCGQICVSGNGTDCVDCEVNPTSLNFGNVCVGQSVDRSFTIRNTGSTTLSGSVSESNTQYSIVSGGGSYNLSPGQSRTVTVRFCPTSTGIKTCTIQTGSACDNVTCTGVGTTASCSVMPTSLDFGNVCPGDSKDRSFTIRNSGNSCNLTGSVNESCSHYSIVSGGGSYNLSPGQSRTVTVRFAPTSASSNPKSCTILSGNSACSNVSCTGKSNCQEAEIHFYNFRRDGSGIIASVVTSILSWNLSQLTLVEYDVGDMKTATDCAAGSYTSLQIYQDQQIPPKTENWLFPKYGSADGLPIPSACTSVDMRMEGRLEASPSSTQGFFCKTDRGGFSRRYSISTLCRDGSYNIDDAYIYSAPTGTRFYYWFEEPGNLKDGWISEMDLDFNGWWIPISGMPPVYNEGTVKIISAKEHPELLLENQKQKSEEN